MFKVFKKGCILLVNIMMAHNGETITEKKGIKRRKRAGERRVKCDVVVIMRQCWKISLAS